MPRTVRACAIRSWEFYNDTLMSLVYSCSMISPASQAKFQTRLHADAFAFRRSDNMAWQFRPGSIGWLVAAHLLVWIVDRFVSGRRGISWGCRETKYGLGSRRFSRSGFGKNPARNHFGFNFGTSFGLISEAVSVSFSETKIGSFFEPEIGSQV